MRRLVLKMLDEVAAAAPHFAACDDPGVEYRRLRGRLESLVQRHAPDLLHAWSLLQVDDMNGED